MPVSLCFYLTCIAALGKILKVEPLCYVPTHSRKFVTDVLPMTFNVLVTTYEFIMRDRSKLTKLDWKYIIIDEAQRLKVRWLGRD